MSLRATIINDLCMNLLENILARLPAVDFASADCVNHLWHLVCARILSRPKLSSACSFSNYPQVAAKDVLMKILSEPIRPHFAIVSVDPSLGPSVYCAFREAHKIITAKLGSRVPVITIFSDTNMGRDAISDESREDTRETGIIMLTVGFLPGMKVKQISLLQKDNLSSDPQAFMIDEFLKDIREFSTSISGCQSPAAIMIFSVGLHVTYLPITMVPEVVRRS
ncbi:putative F-box-like domain superfamily protein [Helianthus annuus]|nr:putative F-box-like domain superfamily protein [Helianthus annuus]